MSALEISAEQPQPQNAAQNEAPKKVSFAFSVPAQREADLGESARLLEHQAFPSFPRHSSDDGSPAGSSSMVPPSPQVLTATATALPHNFSTPPGNVDEWPKEPLRIPCTRCGHFIETTTNEETEYMGCKPCFKGGAVFRRSFVHYCPNCNEPIGFHYTGEDCFCDTERSTMSCDSVLTAACCVWPCCD